MREPRSNEAACLCTWALRTVAGSFLGDPLGKSTTSFLDMAHAWLWTSSEAQAKATELAPKIGRTELTAVRMRP